MGITEFVTEEEMDDHFEEIEDINFRYLGLKEEVEEKRKELEDAEKELSDFEEDHKGQLL